jgi:FkbM family methyltransferase
MQKLKIFFQIFRPIIKKIPELDMAFRIARENSPLFESTQITPMGFKFVGNESMKKNEFEPNETNNIIQIMQHIDIFVNVGANIGYYCCIALKHQKKVYAFEPIRSNLNILYKNILDNNWEDNIEIHPVALSNKTGIIKIYGSGTGASLIKGWADTPEHHAEFVTTATMDNLGFVNRLVGQQAFFIVDIEGAEKFMLEGAQSILKLHPKPFWMMEVCIKHHQPKGTSINPHLLETFKMFWENGYSAWTADDRKNLVTEDDINKIIKTEIDHLDAHNFFFADPAVFNTIFKTGS